MKNLNILERVLDGSRKRRTILILFDAICFAAVTAFYYLIALRAANSMPVDDMQTFFLNALLQMFLVFAARYLLGIYNNVWRYSNTTAYMNLVVADAVGSMLAVFISWMMNRVYSGFYKGVWQAVTIGSLTALVALMSRFSYSLLYKSRSKMKSTKTRIPVAIAGAGRLGTYLAGDLRNNPNSGYEPLFFVDRDATKIGNHVSGLKVYDPDTAEHLIAKLGIREVIISITNKDSEELSELYYHYRGLGCKVRVYDSLVTENNNQKGVLREFSLEDLLFRKTLNVSDQASFAYYTGKTVLVTGGGGSIGSELCRQISQCNPKKLVIFDIYENNAYDIQQELLRTYGSQLNLVVEIGSVRDIQRLDALFATHRPDVVFHAAAHKHVPLMESCGAEAVKNNCMGTYNTANAAEKYGAEKFIMISTDKAVNPTNLMGASKRMCEMIIQCRTDSATSFAAVRFGNVLGSNGSVIPLFRRQIAEGGPVTITDKRIIRYFMTIPEASQLVIQAGAMAKRGELFVLDMGRPVKIYDLAVNMIQLSGLELDRDIRIEEIGLRPGEKLYEELLMKTEQMDKTDNDMIFVERDTPYTRQQVEEKLAILLEAVKTNGSIKDAIAKVVPTYCEPEAVNSRAEHSEEMKQAACV